MGEERLMRNSKWRGRRGRQVQRTPGGDCRCRSAKAATGNQGCLGNLALLIKRSRLRASVSVPVGPEMGWVSVRGGVH